MTLTWRISILFREITRRAPTLCGDWYSAAVMTMSCRLHSRLETPRTIVQFWDNLNQLPADVRDCILSWHEFKTHGFELLLFDDDGARDFIARKLGPRYEHAYSKCYHPAMQSDYFRLCYILVEGGFYLDADDVYGGAAIDHLFGDGRLKIQPLCYDVLTNQMIPPSVFTELGANASSWIFYFNNNPLLAARGHPVLERALQEPPTPLSDLRRVSCRKSSQPRVPETLQNRFSTLRRNAPTSKTAWSCFVTGKMSRSPGGRSATGAT